MKRLLSITLAITLIISIFAVPTTANPAAERVPASNRIHVDFEHIHGGSDMFVGAIMLTNLTDEPIDEWVMILDANFGIFTPIPSPTSIQNALGVTLFDYPYTLDFTAEFITTNLIGLLTFEFTGTTIPANETVSILLVAEMVRMWAELMPTVQVMSFTAIAVPEATTTPASTETSPTTANPVPETSPTESSTEPPTSPTTAPTTSPTTERTTRATTERTTIPTQPTTAPTTAPTSESTTEPTTESTTESTTEPTTESTTEPTTAPTTSPTTVPTTSPTTAPTTSPTTESTTPTPPTSPSGHAVVFAPDNGEPQLIAEVADGGEIGELPTFERPGYTFGGWVEQLDFIHGDVTGNGLIEVADAIQILRRLVGLPNEVENANPLITPQTQIARDVTFVARWAAITPGVPANFAATPAAGAVTLNWDAVEWASGYEVMRADSRLGTYTLIATITSGSVATFRDTANGRWFYTVRAFRDTDGVRLYGEFAGVAES